MPAKPPPLPEAVYQRVMRVARVEGYSILIIAGMGAFMSAGAGSVIPAIAACLVAGAGAMEIHGSQQLARGDETAVNWLVRAQLLLMAIILAYSIWQLTHFDESFVRAQLPEFRRQMADISQKWNFDNPYPYFSDEQLVSMTRLIHSLTYCAVGVVTCVYQGLMARYYHKRRTAIAQALADNG